VVSFTLLPIWIGSRVCRGDEYKAIPAGNRPPS